MYVKKYIHPQQKNVFFCLCYTVTMIIPAEFKHLGIDTMVHVNPGLIRKVLEENCELKQRICELECKVEEQKQEYCDLREQLDVSKHECENTVLLQLKDDNHVILPPNIGAVKECVCADDDDVFHTTVTITPDGICTQILNKDSSIGKIEVDQYNIISKYYREHGSEKFIEIDMDNDISIWVKVNDEDETVKFNNKDIDFQKFCVRDSDKWIGIGADNKIMVDLNYGRRIKIDADENNIKNLDEDEGDYPRQIVIYGDGTITKFLE